MGHYAFVGVLTHASSGAGDRRPPRDQPRIRHKPSSTRTSLGYPSPIPSINPSTLDVSARHTTITTYFRTSRAKPAVNTLSALFVWMWRAYVLRATQRPMQTGRQGVAVAPPSSLRVAVGAYLESAQPLTHDAQRRNYLCLPVSTCPEDRILASGKSRGTTRLALWRIGVGRNPAGLFDVEMCEQMTVSAPTCQLWVSPFLLSILTHRLQNRNPTFDWFLAPYLTAINRL